MPNALEFNQIIQSLSSLNRTQLEQLRSRASWYLQHRSSSVGNTMEEEDWLLSGIFTELERRGLDNRNSANFRIKNMKSWGSYQTKSERVRTLLENAAPNLSFTERRALGQVSAKSLARYIDNRFGVSLDTMLFRVHLTLSAIEKDYPGYLGSRLLSVVVQAHQ